MIPQRFNLEELGTGQKIYYVTIGSLISEILSSPLERAKVVLQTKEVFFTKSPFFYKELAITLQDIKKTEGVRRLWYGARSGVDRQIFMNFGRIYGYYAIMNNLFQNPTHVFSKAEVFFSTIFGTTIGTLLTQPPEVLKVKLQSERISPDASKFETAKNKMQELYKSHGKQQSVFFTGLKTNLILQNTHAVIEVFTFFSILDVFRRANIFSSENSINLCTIFLANAFSTLITAPLDYLHTRHIFRGLQVKFNIENNKKKYPIDMPAYALNTFKTEGISAFYKGFIPYFFKTSINNMILALIFNRALDREEKRRQYTSILISEIESRRDLELDRFRE